MRTYGKITRDGDNWVMENVPPHVCIRLKALFRKIPTQQPPPFTVEVSGPNAVDLIWFIGRYPMEMSLRDQANLHHIAGSHNQELDEIESMLSQDIAPRQYEINGQLRDYQSKGVHMYLVKNRLLIGDSVGLGKTLIAIGSFTDKSNLPALVVCQAHLPPQWMGMMVQFLGLKAHIIKKGTPYPLPPADVYLSSYHKLSGWTDIFRAGKFKSAVFDECQELRKSDSQKYQASQVLSENVQRCLGLSATPVYNYGDEIYNILDVINPGCLGGQEAFLREWGSGWEGKMVKNPKALGTFLRDEQLFLRRTKRDVGRELDPVNRIVERVEHHHEDEKNIMKLAESLAQRVVSGEFTERGMAARELDMMVRMATGVGKARSVAAYVRMLLEDGEKILLVGWHRDCYQIWNSELRDFSPVMYTGSESPTQKEKSKHEFINGDAQLMIMSLRSGVGLDGLQKVCSTVVFGELDWSPQVHEQVIGRLDRDGQTEPVTALYLVSNWGSDPLIVDLLGIKEEQSQGILDPLSGAASQHTDRSRIKELAERFLKKGKKK